MAIDLVCKMDVNENAWKPSFVLEGKTYYFCSEGCRAEFKRRPQDYLKVAEADSCCEAPPEEKENRNV